MAGLVGCCAASALLAWLCITQNIFALTALNTYQLWCFGATVLVLVGCLYYCAKHYWIPWVVLQVFKRTTMPTHIICWTRTGRIKATNLTTQRFFDTRNKTLIASTLAKAVRKDSEEAYKALFASSARHPAQETCLELVVNKKRCLLKVRTTALGKNHIIWHFDVLQSLDRSDLNDSHFVSLLQMVPLPVVAVNALGRVSYANPALLEWLLVSSKKILGAHFNSLLAHNSTPVADFTPPKLLSFIHAQGYQKQGLLVGEYRLNTALKESIYIFMPQVFTAGEKGEAHLAFFVESMPLPGICLDHSGVIRLANRSFEKLIRERKILGRSLHSWLSADHANTLEQFLTQTRRQNASSDPLTLTLKGKEDTTMHVYGTHMPNTGWDPLGCFLLVFYDVTELKKREQQTIDSQKLQALGQLASGISHDFNNLLTAMLGFCDLLLQRHTPQDSSFTDIMQIKQNANRAANLIRQLLLFAKQAPLAFKEVDLKACLNEMSFLLRRLIGSKIELCIEHDRDVSTIFADQGQIEQLIMNLGINARDAMPKGGTLTFKTSTVAFKKATALAAKTSLQPGDYVKIAITDTGIGISKQNISKIFDPFFSTKESTGTGLGLATVKQIIEQMEGGIDIKSTEGKGTSFFLYLPQNHQAHLKQPQEAPPDGHLLDFQEFASILVVEDEDPVRLFVTRALKSKGYEVYEAKDGPEGLDTLKRHKGIQLMITDVMMPGMDGPALASAAFEQNPKLKVLFVSGYPQETLSEQMTLPKEQVYFLPKPFSLGKLTEKVHDVLGKQQP